MGGGFDFCPYREYPLLYSTSYYDGRPVKFILEKGANPNSISWIGIGGDTPLTPLDSISDDINAYGEDQDLSESFRLIEDAGGKFFSEIVPDFYYDE